MRRILPQSVVLALLGLLALSAPVLGAPSSGAGVRSLGMGGAYTAVADDASAPSWNPAGITQLSFAANGTLGAQSSLSTLMAVGAGLINTTWAWDQFDLAPENLLPWISNHLQYMGQPLHDQQLGPEPVCLGGNLSVGVATPWVALTARTDAESTFSLVPAGTSFVPVGTSSAKATALLTGAFRTSAAAVGAEWLSVGVNLKAFYLVEGETTLDSVTNVYSLTLMQGQGLACDVGALLKLGKNVRFGAVLQDLIWWGSGRYWVYEDPIGSISGAAPTTDLWNPAAPAPTLSFGGAYSPGDTGMTLALDLQRIKLPGTGTSDPASLNAGFEQVYGPVALRLGTTFWLTQPSVYLQYSGGVGLRLGAFRMDVGAAFDRVNQLSGRGELSIVF